VKTTVLIGRAALSAFDARWDALAAACELPNPLLSAPWLRAAGAGRPFPLVVLAEEDGALAAAGAFEVRRPGGRLGPRVATWLGPPEQLRAADLLALPGRADGPAAVVRALLRHVDVVSVRVRSTGAAAAALDDVAPWRRREPTGDGSLLDLPPPRLDHARARRAREARRAARLGLRVDTCRSVWPEDVARALERLFRLHRARWDGRDDELERFGSTAALRAWNRRTIGALAEAGRVVAVEVLEDGRVVAGNLCLQLGRGAVGHTQAIAPGELHDPGHAAMLAAMELLHERGAEVVALGVGGAEPGSPKARLGARPDPAAIVVAAASPQRQHLVDALHRARRRAA
jgi:hypothetical protein